MEDESGSVLRWHVARFHGGSQGDPHAKEAPAEPWLEVVIARASDNLPADLGGGLAPVFGRTDQLDWWESGDDRLLHGWVLEEAVREALENAERIDSPAALLAVRRRITEDMVFLQCAVDADSMAKYWEQACGSTALPDVTSLVALSKRWCDFTRPARRMAKSIYARALKDSEGDTAAIDGGPHAAK